MTTVSHFPVGVAERLKWYVYRLIDPRMIKLSTLEKVKADRIFQHAKLVLALGNGEDATDLKFQRIKNIKPAVLELAQVIHLHNIVSAEVAFQMEAALINAYPGLTNRVSGQGSGDYEVRHVTEIISEYAGEPLGTASSGT